MNLAENPLQYNITSWNTAGLWGTNISTQDLLKEIPWDQLLVNNLYSPFFPSFSISYINQVVDPSWQPWNPESPWYQSISPTLFNYRFKFKKIL